MFDTALTFLRDELNSYLRTRTGVKSDIVTLGRIVKHTGEYAFGEQQVCLSVVNIEEERVLKSHLPERVEVAGQQFTLEPEIKLNLHVIFAFNFNDYPTGLRYLAHVMTFFQSHPSFAAEEYPGLHPAVRKLVVEMQSLSFEQLNQVWAFIGGKQLLSVIYRLRMLALQDRAEAVAGPPIRTINATVHGR